MEDFCSGVILLPMRPLASDPTRRSTISIRSTLAVAQLSISVCYAKKL